MSVMDLSDLSGKLIRAFYKPIVELSPSPIATPVDQRLIDFPFYININTSNHYFTHSVNELIQKYSLVDNIDYVQIPKTGSYSYSSFSDVRFKNKQYVDEIVDAANTKIYVVDSIEQYSNPGADNSFYDHALHIAKEGKMSASINFFPKKDRMPNITQEIISFYVANGYNLPHDAATFKAKYLVTGGRGFTVYLKSEEDAASLLLQLSDLIDVI